jgi:hypothetical protein
MSTFWKQYSPTGNRGLWFWLFHLLLNRTHPADASAGRPLTDPDQAWLFDELLHSRNAVMAVYAQAAKLLGKF